MKILALIDGSIYSQSVCDHSAWISQRAGAAIEIVHVLGRRETGSAPQNLSGAITLGARTALLEELTALDAEKAKLSQKRGRAILDDAQAAIVAAGVADVTVKLRRGDVVGTVTELEEGADIVVIGKRGEAADFATMHLGSNLERVVRASSKPVFVASRAFRPIGEFVIAYDGGASALKAVDYIARSSLFAGLTCRLLLAGSDTAENRKVMDKPRAILEASGYDVSAEVSDGQPDRVLADAVERDGIGMLIMGAYSSWRIKNLIIGSTTTEMIRSCKVPIMLFR